MGIKLKTINFNDDQALTELGQSLRIYIDKADIWNKAILEHLRTKNLYINITLDQGDYIIVKFNKEHTQC